MSAELLPLVDAIEQASGRRPHLSTAIRWATRGIAGIRLETTCFGSKRLTTVANVLAFFDAIGHAKNEEHLAIVATPKQRSKAIEQASADLAKLVGKKTKAKA